MTLVDTSVWIDHLRRGNELLVDLLNQGRAVTHPMVIGELSLGNISERGSFLELVRNLPVAKEATHDEVFAFIEKHRMWNKGLGFFDMHILCSSLIESIPLWTLDKRLAAVAQTFGRDTTNK
jgi:predicted nucleic acid-binding protein